MIEEKEGILWVIKQWMLMKPLVELVINLLKYLSDYASVSYGGES